MSMTTSQEVKGTLSEPNLTMWIVSRLSDARSHDVRDDRLHPGDQVQHFLAGRLPVLGVAA